jgi:apolipoprotein D and lipocalin family protein
MSKNQINFIIFSMKHLIIIILFSLLFISCVGIPEGIQPVQNFDVKRYLGTWYEIARLDHSFERGLNNISATYTLRDDGGIDVLNRGFDNKKNKWKEAKGKAHFIGEKTVASLKVSFFGPFYGGYNVIALDKDHYSYAMVCGPDRSYLWILSREKALDKEILDKLIERARRLGFDTDKLIFVAHNL